MYPPLVELLDNLTTYIDKAKNFHDQILCQTETEDIANEITQASTFYDSLHELLAKVSITIDGKSESNSSISTQPNNQTSTTLT